LTFMLAGSRWRLMKARFAGLLLAWVFVVNAAAQRRAFLPAELRIEIDPEADGTTVPWLSATFTYDGRELVQTISDVDFTGDGIMDERSTVTTTYNRRGQRILRIAESFSLTDGTLEQRSTNTFTYDRQGHLASNLYYHDWEGDGTVDRILRSTYEFDSRGRLLRGRVETDRNADGTWDEVTTYTRTYDARGNAVLDLRESDGNLDGIIDYIVQTAYTLDARGNVTLAVTEIDFEADGDLDGVDRLTYSYDSSGRRESATIEYVNGYGLVEARTTVRYTYESHDLLVRVVEEFDADADGTVDGIQITTRTYVNPSGSR